MVTIAFAAIGSAVAPSLGIAALIGQIAGGMLGAYVDSAFLMPALFPGEEPEPEEISALPISAFNEGGKLSKLFGKYTRVDGQVIWASRPEYVVVRKKVGAGKGGGGQSTVDVQYYIDVAIAIGEAPYDPATGKHKIQSVQRILANGQDLFVKESSIDITKTDIRIEPFQKGVRGYWVSSPGVGWELLYYPVFYNRYISASGGYQMTKFATGQDVTVSGYANGNNNGKFNVTKAEASPSPSTETFIEVELGLGTLSVGGMVGIPFPTDMYPDVVTTTGGVAEAAGPSARFQMTIPTWSSEDVEDIQFYLGDQTAVDPTIATIMEPTTGKVPVHQGIAYLVLKNLFLNNYSNSIPTFVIEAEAHDNLDMKTGIELILDSYDFPMDLVEVDPALQSETLSGIAIRGSISAGKAIQPLLIAHDIIGQKKANGSVRLFKRENTYEHTLNMEDFAVAEGDDEPTTIRPFKTTRLNSDELPTKVEVSFLDVDNQLETMTQKDTRVRSGGSETVQNVNLPITLSGAEAKAIARRLLHTQSSERERIAISLPSRYLRIVENDQVTFVYKGREYHILVSRVDRGANFLVEIEGVVIEPGALFQPVIVDARNSLLKPIRSPNKGPSIRLQVWDMPALEQSGLDRAGTWLTANRTDSKDKWQGAVVQSKKLGAAGGYKTLTTIKDEATIGFTSTILGGWDETANPWLGGWDRVNEFTVILETGVLKDATPTDMISKLANVCAIGGEILAFNAAQLIAANTYRCTGLLRGLMGTEDKINSHFINEPFVFIDAPGVLFVDFALKDIGAQHSFIAASDTAGLARARPVNSLVTGKALAPPPMGWYRVIRFLNNIGIVFYARTRNFQDAFVGRPTDVLKWEIEVLDSAGLNVVATYKIDATQGSQKPPEFARSTQWVYTATQQIRDGFKPSPWLRINLRVYQISPHVGRGRPKLITV